jgi:hypothetical protein
MYFALPLNFEYFSRTRVGFLIISFRLSASRFHVLVYRYLSCILAKLESDAAISFFKTSVYAWPKIYVVIIMQFFCMTVYYFLKELEYPLILSPYR